MTAPQGEPLGSSVDALLPKSESTMPPTRQGDHSTAITVPGILLQLASESAKPEETSEAAESLESVSQFTSKGSLAPLQPIIVVEPKADDGEFSVVVTANTKLSINPPEVEQLVVPPVGEVAQMSEGRMTQSLISMQSLLLLRLNSQTTRM